MNFLINIPKNIEKVLIRIYQKTLSFDHSFWAPYLAGGYRVCIYTPSCSEYTYQAVDRFGVIKGSWMGFKRILRCNPFSKGGYDPVPESSSHKDHNHS
mgnify:FL=1